jgi:hypothetical protein
MTLNWLWAIVPAYLAGWVICARWIYNDNDGTPGDVSREVAGMWGLVWPAVLVIMVLVSGVPFLIRLPTWGISKPLVARANYQRDALPGGHPVPGSTVVCQLPPGHRGVCPDPKKIKGPSQ